MRIFHKDHGYHFVTDTNELAALTALGWVAAPKGFQKTLNNGNDISQLDIDINTALVRAGSFGGTAWNQHSDRMGTIVAVVEDRTQPARRGRKPRAK